MTDIMNKTQSEIPSAEIFITRDEAIEIQTKLLFLNEKIHWIKVNKYLIVWC